MAKKIIVTIVTVIMATMGLFGSVGCGGTKGGGEAVDTTKTQLYVYNYNGGFGSEWLSAYKAKYEELHKDDVYEEGKKGVQVMLNNVKATPTTAEIMANYTNDVYFVEHEDYYSLVNNNAVADITDCVTSPNPYDGGKTILSKFLDGQGDYYAVGEGANAKYYSIPHYAGSYGIVYNIDLFDEMCYYFKDGYEEETKLEDKFIYSLDETKSKGPDGVAGTSDDGLPATYDDFYDLCNYIVLNQQIPFVWTGQYYQQHLMTLFNNIAATEDGYDQVMLNYTLDGVATTLGKIDNNNAFVKDDEPTTIHTANGTEQGNGYLLKVTEGKYEALNFVARLINQENWQNREAFKTTFSHLDAQRRFVSSMGDPDLTETAMLVDGTWWSAEATTAFNEVASRYGSQYSKANANYGWMPFPHSTKDKVGTQQVLFDFLNATCFVNAHSQKQKLAKDFLQFVNADEQLVLFTQKTNTIKALKYTLTDSQLSALNPFGQSVIRFTQSENTKLLFPQAKTKAFINNYSIFFDYAKYYKVSETSNSTFVKLIRENSYSAGQCIKENYNYYKTIWNSLDN